MRIDSISNLSREVSRPVCWMRLPTYLYWTESHPLNIGSFSYRCSHFVVWRVESYNPCKFLLETNLNILSNHKVLFWPPQVTIYSILGNLYLKLNKKSWSALRCTWRTSLFRRECAFMIAFSKWAVLTTFSKWAILTAFRAEHLGPLLWPVQNAVSRK